jgi:hypothetical protein
MINFQDEMQNMVEFTHFEKFIFIQQWLTQNMWSIGENISIYNNKLQKISFKKKNHMKKWKKTKKDCESFCKVILLAPFYILAPIHKCKES